MADFKAFKDQGNDHFKAGRYAAAVEAYTKAIELNPSQHTTYSNRSAAYVKLGGKDAEALADAERCVEIEPGWAKGHSRKAAALIALGRFEEAEAACEAGLFVASDDSREHLAQMQKTSRNLAFAAKLKGRWHGSVSEELGAYVQEFDFLNSKDLMVSVMGRTCPGTFSVDASQNPVGMDIQVIPPETPPGCVPPPAPYIARFSEAGSLELCCPYMVQQRPTSFDGPGFCELKRGGMAKEVDDSIKSLSTDERLLKCAEATLEMMPDTVMEQPSEFDSEDVAHTKMLAHVKFQSSIFKLESTYGEDTLKQVLTNAHENPSLAGAYGEVIQRLRKKMQETGLLPSAEGGSAQSKPQESTGSAGKAAAAPSSQGGDDASTKAANVPSKATKEAEGSTAAPAPPLDAVAPYVLGAAVALGAAALAFTWWRSRRR